MANTNTPDLYATHLDRAAEFSKALADLQKGDRLCFTDGRVRLWTVVCVHGDAADLDDPEGKGRTFTMIPTIAPSVAVFQTERNGETFGAAHAGGLFRRVNVRRYQILARRETVTVDRSGTWYGVADVPAFYLDAHDAAEAISKARAILGGKTAGSVVTDEGRTDYKAWSDL